MDFQLQIFFNALDRGIVPDVPNELARVRVEVFSKAEQRNAFEGDEEIRTVVKMVDFQGVYPCSLSFCETDGIEPEDGTFLASLPFGELLITAYRSDFEVFVISDSIAHHINTSNLRLIVDTARIKGTLYAYDLHHFDIAEQTTEHGLTHKQLEMLKDLAGQYPWIKGYGVSRGFVNGVSYPCVRVVALEGYEWDSVKRDIEDFDEKVLAIHSAMLCRFEGLNNPHPVSAKFLEDGFVRDVEGFLRE
ncbi:MAG TPA: hypothetical protein PKB15_06380 [Acidimicrobiia bacterium]|nr:hypothetical protein [Acidimicrobiia bacterium]